VAHLELEATEIAGSKPITPDPRRYDRMAYRVTGASGLALPAISLGAWMTVAGYRDASEARAAFRHAFDLGVTHFDFANNYGSPPGMSEVIGGEIIKRDLPRDEVIVSSNSSEYELNAIDALSRPRNDATERTR
jgi:aryl-alcohol dehydrogenase-like predicted oxidoreductase